MFQKKLKLLVFLTLFSLFSFSTKQVVLSEVADSIEALSEKVLGNENAPITLIEYASLTCHHCATFHNEVLPKIKSDYIDTGKLKFIYRDFPLDHYALMASMVARCAGNKKFFTFLKVLFKEQPKWTAAKDPFIALGHIARIGGIGKEEFKSCVGNKAIEDGILKSRIEADREFKIESTPTLIINGEKYDGARTFKKLKKYIDKLLTKSG
ncbi:MAG: Disulfide bond formation protein D [Alphaproteobacteria bacterium MarineAlpha7_Bin1]|nr:MAG: Disulfide bond formation protein D [Alphaproteobacteria bacterium MarineAlpha7_Bin1]